mmetsp:Transcript_116524/g.370621  ORF Transcript_116524/g.370621 Transcript_116524/m.370621 type:complete len:234 (+) Transcript_116524:1281-1982(+)
MRAESSGCIQATAAQQQQLPVAMRVERTVPTLQGRKRRTLLLADCRDVTCTQGRRHVLAAIGRGGPMAGKACHSSCGHLGRIHRCHGWRWRRRRHGAPASAARAHVAHGRWQRRGGAGEGRRQRRGTSCWQHTAPGTRLRVGASPSAARRPREVLRQQTRCPRELREGASGIQKRGLVLRREQGLEKFGLNREPLQQGGKQGMATRATTGLVAHRAQGQYHRSGHHKPFGLRE